MLKRKYNQIWFNSPVNPVQRNTIVTQQHLSCDRVLRVCSPRRDRESLIPRFWKNVVRTISTCTMLFPSLGHGIAQRWRVARVEDFATVTARCAIDLRAR